MRMLEDIEEAKSYLRLNDPHTRIQHLDAVVASTSPKISMDLKRADYAVAAVKGLYGNTEDYHGLWIAAGELNQNSSGERLYQGSQIEGIIERLSKHGVKKEKIIHAGGADTVDKIRHLAGIPEIKNSNGQYFIGVASYPLHIARFNLALKYVQREKIIGEGATIVGIEMPYDAIFFDTNPRLRIGDWVAGVAGLAKDARRLEKLGFECSVPGQESYFHRKLKELNSEDRRGRDKH